MAYILVKARPCGVQLSSQSQTMAYVLVKARPCGVQLSSQSQTMAYVLVNARSCGVQLSSQSLPIKHNKQCHMYWSKLGLVEYSFHLADTTYQTQQTMAYVWFNARSCGAQLSSQSLPTIHIKQWHLYWSMLGLVEYSIHLTDSAYHTQQTMTSVLVNARSCGVQLLSGRHYVSNTANNGICMVQC